jgi:hypothetical protein
MIELLNQPFLCDIKHVNALKIALLLIRFYISMHQELKEIMFVIVYY